MLLLLKCFHLLLETPEGNDGERSKEKDADDYWVEDGRLDEGEAMLGPVVEVGRLREGSNPDHQADQGGGVEDRYFC